MEYRGSAQDFNITRAIKDISLSDIAEAFLRANPALMTNEVQAYENVMILHYIEEGVDLAKVLHDENLSNYFPKATNVIAKSLINKFRVYKNDFFKFRVQAQKGEA